jgi:hypothetical protein
MESREVSPRKDLSTDGLIRVIQQTFACVKDPRHAEGAWGHSMNPKESVFCPSKNSREFRSRRARCFDFARRLKDRCAQGGQRNVPMLRGGGRPYTRSTRKTFRDEIAEAVKSNHIDRQQLACGFTQVVTVLAYSAASGIHRLWFPCHVDERCSEAADQLTPGCWPDFKTL